jgi:GNS1/SUR4 family
MESESWIRHYFYDLADPRARDRLFMGSPYPLMLWIVIYVAIVRALKLWMRNRKSYDFSKIGIAANIYFIVGNGYIFFKVAPYWLNKYNWRCEPLDTSHSMDALQVCLQSSYTRPWPKLNSNALKPFFRWWTWATSSRSSRLLSSLSRFWVKLTFDRFFNQIICCIITSLSQWLHGSARTIILEVIQRFWYSSTVSFIRWWTHIT